MFEIEAEKRGVRDEFDQKAAEYETNRLAGWYKAHNDIIAAHLELQAGDKLLDIGCATGYLIRRMLNAHSGVTAIGVDLSPDMIATAEYEAESMADRTSFFCADWEMPSPALSERLAAQDINFAVCASAFHYFSDPVAALARVRDCLAPGGVLYLLERRREWSPPTIAWDLAHRYVIKDHVRFYSSGTLLGMIRQAGFAQGDVVQTVRKRFWHNKISTNLTLIKAVR